jgi:hypothetical protein
VDKKRFSSNTYDFEWGVVAEVLIDTRQYFAFMRLGYRTH